MYPEHHLVKTGHIDRCQVCNSDKLHLVLDLGHQPLCDSLLTKEQLNEPEIMYPLRMYWCKDCSAAQIDYCVEGSIVYHPNYPYKSGVTKELVEYQRSMSISLISKYNLKQGDFVIDIGSNDGTLLKGFKDAGIKVLGVEPTNIAKIANQDGIETIQEFFTEKLYSHQYYIGRKEAKNDLKINTVQFADKELSGFLSDLYEEYKKEMGLNINSWNPEAELGENAVQNRKDYKIAYIESKDLSNYFQLSIEYKKQQVNIAQQTPQGPIQIPQEQVGFRIFGQGWK